MLPRFKKCLAGWLQLTTLDNQMQGSYVQKANQQDIIDLTSGYNTVHLWLKFIFIIRQLMQHKESLFVLWIEYVVRKVNG